LVFGFVIILLVPGESWKWLIMMGALIGCLLVGFLIRKYYALGLPRADLTYKEVAWQLQEPDESEPDADEPPANPEIIKVRVPRYARYELKRDFWGQVRLVYNRFPSVFWITAGLSLFSFGIIRYKFFERTGFHPTVFMEAFLLAGVFLLVGVFGLIALLSSVGYRAGKGDF
jgi:hypothetical protein